MNHQFEEKGEKCVFIGYSSKLKGYRLFSLKRNKVIISQDVIVDENSKGIIRKEKVYKVCSCKSKKCKSQQVSKMKIIIKKKSNLNLLQQMPSQVHLLQPQH